MMKLHSIVFVIISSILFVGCSKKEQDQAQGYIEAKFTYLGAGFSGKVAQLNVDRGSRVKAGQILFTLEAQPENADFLAQQQQVAQAQAAITQANAAVKLAEINLRRAKTLAQNGTLQKSALDEAQSTYDQSKAEQEQVNAKLAAAKAGLTKASWANMQKTVAAPYNGTVFDTYYLVGEIVPTGQPVVSLLAPENIKAIFYISENQLSQIKIAAPITVRCDRCEQNLVGKISYISTQAEYTPPVIFSTETRSKLVYRVEADFKPDVAVRLHPGQPITVSYK